MKSIMVGIRLKEDIYEILKVRAKGKSVAEYIKLQILKSVAQNRSEITIENPIKPLPLYNPAIHKAGDRVLMRVGKKLIPTVVPELDAEGKVIPL